MSVLQGCSLPPNTCKSLFIGTLSFRLYNLQCSLGSLKCRIQFWGESSHVDLHMNDDFTASHLTGAINSSSYVEYPLVGSICTLRKYFSDLGYLPILVMSVEESHQIIVGQGYLPMIQIFDDLVNAVHLDSWKKRKINSFQLKIPVIPIEKCSKVLPSSCQQNMGEIEMEVVLRLNMCEKDITDDKMKKENNPIKTSKAISVSELIISKVF